MMFCLSAVLPFNIQAGSLEEENFKAGLAVTGDKCKGAKFVDVVSNYSDMLLESKCQGSCKTYLLACKTYIQENVPKLYNTTPFPVKKICPQGEDKFDVPCACMCLFVKEYLSFL